MSKEAIVITVIILYILLHSLVLEPNSIKITKYEVECNALSGIRVAFLSDLHLKKTDYKRLDKIVKLTKKEEPDIVLLGGDYAKTPAKEQNMKSELFAEKIRTIDKPAYSVLGDDDYLAGSEEIKAALKKKQNSRS